MAAMLAIYDITGSVAIVLFTLIVLATLSGHMLYDIFLSEHAHPTKQEVAERDTAMQEEAAVQTDTATQMILWCTRGSGCLHDDPNCRGWRASREFALLARCAFNTK